MNNLDSISVIPKNGSETFSFKNNTLDFNLKDFWSWSQSDLLNNSLRGVVAEYIVRQDFKIEKTTRTEWDAFDFVTESGIKVEVKSSAYLQSWKQKILSKISFGIAPTFGWNAQTNEYSKKKERQSDFYVFCLLHHQDKETIDPTNLDQWTFYVLKTQILDKQKREQKTIRLNPLLKLKPIKCQYGEIRNIIYNC